MDTTRFREAFWKHFKGAERNQPAYEHWDPIVSYQLDLCPDVEGMLSLKKQQLLNLAYSLLPEEEAYFEVGTYQGKSLLSAMLRNPERRVFACDNFSLFEGNSLQTTMANLERYHLRDKVTFYDMDFRDVYTKQHLPIPIGFYFYDGSHELDCQYDAIRLVEPFLADEALVVVDDWRQEIDSPSYARVGTLRAIGESKHFWKLLYELPARFNGDRAMWWNGVAVLVFQRNSEA